MTANALKTSLSALETISFILPGPWGPIASAALNVFGTLIDPEQPDPNKPVLDAINAGFADLKGFLTSQKIDEASDYVKTMEKWLASTGDLKTLDTNTSTLQKVIDAVKSLSTIEIPANAVETAISAVEATLKNADTKSQNYMDLAQAAISTLIGLRVSQASCLNYRVLLQQKLVCSLQNSDRDEDKKNLFGAMQDLQSYFDFLCTTIKDYLAEKGVLNDFEAKCDDVRDKLVNRIGSVTYEGSEPTWPWDSAESDGYYYQDNCAVPIRYDELKNQWDTVLVSGAMGDFTTRWEKKTDRKHEVEQLRANRIVALKKQCDDFKQDALKILQTAKDKAASGVDGQPAPASTKPTVEQKQTEWNNAWKFTAKWIRYSVQFQGTTITTVASPSSDWLKCDWSSDTCPEVTLPDDPSGYAIGRIVLREVADDQTGHNSTTYAIPLPNMTTKTLVDLCPVNDDDICPTALIAPVIRWCNYDSKKGDPKRTWPEPYRVRYRYKYTNKKGKSLEWSPWSVPFDRKSADFNNDGYYNANYYSAQMLVPPVPNCDFVLQRKFKDEDPKAIKARVAAAGNGLVYLCDDEGP
ncbi:hypothetical protein DF3PA_40139 [Candidatus Defluviicoccus seviourii]|uniref:Uncharacterized protein n=2 Tax=root TaxID=1 RepID=A0A564WI56_9PROT|nr:hypothetical protein DF3PB_730005 [uncultured Defluviicoccus sp.]VUX47263.1 hypothetical protein DF3PA_40139 [Candidatus Defluviicoccus seviourii]